MEGNAIGVLAREFRDCQKILTAIGDESRLHLMLTMMEMGQCGGVRVGDIAATTHLSRPAVSHHLQILKDAGVLGVRKDGTKNYYFFDSEQEAMKGLIRALQDAVNIAASLPGRRESLY